MMFRPFFLIIIAFCSTISAAFPQCNSLAFPSSLPKSQNATEMNFRASENSSFYGQLTHATRADAVDTPLAGRRRYLRRTGHSFIFF